MSIKTIQRRSYVLMLSVSLLFLKVGEENPFLYLTKSCVCFVYLQYHANELLPLKDELIVAKVMHQLSKYIDGLENASVVDQEIGRFPKALTHFFPGSFLRLRIA